MKRSTLSIANTMLPSQEQPRQNFPAPNQFSNIGDWQFNPLRAQQYNWREGNAEQSNDNYFTKEEPHQDIKNGMFNPLTGEEPIYGFINYGLNPLDQEQTNSHMAGYQMQKQTRVSNNMSPAGVMRFPSYNYPVNQWQNVYMGSRNKSNFSTP
jgi:hypothetical protein